MTELITNCNCIYTYILYKQDKQSYDLDIINQLIQFEIGTKSQIMYAMDMVNNRNDINEIADYLASHNNNNNNYNVCCCIIKIIYLQILYVLYIVDCINK